MVILHVELPPVVVYGNGVVIPRSDGDLEQTRAKLLQIKPPDDFIRVEHQLAEGDPATEILKVAEEKHCDLIVMGTHGWTGLNRLLMGSVAEKVVRKAPCPVLTIKTPFPIEETVTGPAVESLGTPLPRTQF
jgi:nucleotide-binding universal stress UspA family protein